MLMIVTGCVLCHGTLDGHVRMLTLIQRAIVTRHITILPPDPVCKHILNLQAARGTHLFSIMYTLKRTLPTRARSQCGIVPSGLGACLSPLGPFSALFAFLLRFLCIRVAIVYPLMRGGVDHCSLYKYTSRRDILLGHIDSWK